MALGRKKEKNPRVETADLRKLSVDELQKMLKDEREKLMRERFEHASAALENTSLLKKSRQQIARVLTVINEKKHEAII